jgi:uncharacterized membrane protein YraQ (UPF0718 family)
MFMFRWLNDQLLKMRWLDKAVRFILENFFGLDLDNAIGRSVHFFIYDVVKIFILLTVLIFFISYIQSFFPPDKTKKIIGKFKGISANIIAAALGTITPFCSCSSIPLFIGFTNAGLPVGITFSFLISSPLVDLASILLLASIFNWKISIAYVLVGLVLAVTGGKIISAFKLEKYVEPFIFINKITKMEQEILTQKMRLAFAGEQILGIIKKVWLYILIGVGIGAFIHNWIPEYIIAAILGSNKWYSIPLATIIGVPIYADIFGTLPIAEALVTKGAGLGTVLSFMMGVTALSLPSVIMLKKVVKPKLLGIFIVIVCCGIIIIGYAFNAFSYLFY